MLREYSDSQLISGVNRLTIRTDLHYQDSSSDKVYIGTVQENTVTGKFEAICFFGRRGNGLQTNDLGAYSTVFYAQNVLEKQMQAKMRKGYKQVGQWINGKGPSTGGRLRPEVIDFLRSYFAVGSRVELIEMESDPTPVPASTQGTVTLIDDIGTVHVKWDNGQGLGLVFGEDKYKKVA